MSAHVRRGTAAAGRFALEITPESAGWEFSGLRVLDLAAGEGATQCLEPRYVPADLVPVELRGAGSASRQVNNVCAPEAFEADRLIAVEVLTPAGNWSSYPPHKHDEQRPGEGTALEEIYFYEVARDGVGFQRVYGSGPGREIDVCAEVRSDLNVMAGPGERAWRFTDDPRHAWIRDSWSGQAVDARLPLTSARGSA